MSKYIDKFVQYLSSINRTRDEEKDPHRKAILNNYCRHAAFEFSNRDYDILSDEMTVPDPYYKVKRFGAELAIYEGLDAVQGYYTAVNREVIMLNDEQLMVNDWGIASYSTLVRFVSGGRLMEEGYQDLEGDAIYVQSSPLAMFWPYDSNAKLLGEDVYELDRPTIEKAAPGDIVTLEMRIEATSAFLPVDA